MSWNCNNTCNVITTHLAQKIIDATTPHSLVHLVHHNPDGVEFHLADQATCLKIVLDLKEGGALVLQRIGLLVANLQSIRPSDVYNSDALQLLRCNALCPSPFSVQLADNVELIVCAACDTCKQPDRDNQYLMLIAFFLALLALLFSLFLYKLWCKPCGVCSIRQPEQTVRAVSGTQTMMEGPKPVSDQYATNQFSDVLLWWKDMCNHLLLSDIQKH